MILSGEEKRILRYGVLGAYPDIDELEMLLVDNNIIKNLASIINYYTPNSDFIIFKLINQLEAKGNLEIFIEIIIKDKPKSPYLENVKIIFDKKNRDKPLFESSYLQEIDKREDNLGEDNLGRGNILNIDHGQLYNQLRELNFSKECGQFREHINSQVIGSFLLSGQKSYGIEILLERLGNLKTFHKICIDLGGNTTVKLEDIWREVAKSLGIEVTLCFPSQMVIDGIIKIQQKQSILLILKSVDKIHPDDLGGILKEFWQELINKIQNCDSHLENNLCLFLVDYSNTYRDKDLAFTFNQKILTNNFQEEDIATWIESSRNRWGAEYCDKRDLDCTQAKTIYQRTSGIPLEVYKEIHRWCGILWKESIMINKVGL
jgi:hypothetical protein